ncbi:MAG: PEGA domain-containing protein, partial [Acidobacteria bacterium]|nr:PEGA domain-containing protein [Acidobacteriota bacterium]
ARAAAGQTAAAPARSAPRAAATARAEAPACGRLVVRSTPPGALVFVNGRRRGRTPLSVRDLAPGTYSLRVARSGFQEDSRRVTIAASAAREVHVRLARARSSAAPAPAAVSFTGALYVDSRPRGARVVLDGRAIGTTPMQVGDIRAGAHVVRLELADHRPWTTSTTIAAGRTTRVTGSLERQ